MKPLDAWFRADCPACRFPVKWSVVAMTGSRWDTTQVEYSIDCGCGGAPSVAVIWPLPLGEYIDSCYDDGYDESEGITA